MTNGDSNIVSRVLGWLTAGYPDGVPTKDYFPLLALLNNSLTTEEVEHVISHLGNGNATTKTDIAVAITHVTNEPPTAAEIGQVAARLAAGGWPLASMK